MYVVVAYAPQTSPDLTHADLPSIHPSDLYTYFVVLILIPAISHIHPYLPPAASPALFLHVPRSIDFSCNLSAFPHTLVYLWNIHVPRPIAIPCTNTFLYTSFSLQVNKCFRS